MLRLRRLLKLPNSCRLGEPAAKFSGENGLPLPGHYRDRHSAKAKIRALRRK